MKTGSEHLRAIDRYIRYLILRATTRAGSGHPTSALSAVELMTGLLFDGFFRYDIEHPKRPQNDRLIFSKGHATPLLYGLWVAAGALSEDEMMTYRTFGSPLEGHPSVALPYVDAATGSLGQGLSIGVGMALNAKYLDRLHYRTYVLLGDSEMAEGSQWEAIQLAAHYRLNNLVGILDVNRLGQRGETMYGHDPEAYRSRVAAFGWHTRVIDGSDHGQIRDAFRWALTQPEYPCMLIAKTMKGQGVSRLEDQNGWHGKTLDEEQLEQALQELGDVDTSVRGRIKQPGKTPPDRLEASGITGETPYEKGDAVPTRNAYGNALKSIYPAFPPLVSLDGEVCNSTRSIYFRDACPACFFEMFVAEQNMVGAAIGLAARGKMPFVSTFAAFLTRAFDQIRMAQYNQANIKFAGSHAGVSIGQDGPSQMGLEDIALFRTLPDSVVLHPCDAPSTEKLVEHMARHEGLCYLRTMRNATPVIYDPDERFPIGGSKTLRQSDADRVTVVGAGITVHEALKAWQTLKNDGCAIRVIDCYSIKPLDMETLRDAARSTAALLTVEDHYAAGGLGEAVTAALGTVDIPVYRLAVRRKPVSGKPQELLEYEGLSAEAIVQQVKAITASE